MDYASALDHQRQLNQQRIDKQAPCTVLMVEHDPVITLTRRRNIRDHLLADDAELACLGIATHETDRGGDITYHGPGQLVVYPILHLPTYQLNLSKYMRLLEQVVIDTIAGFGITAHRDPGATGVWVHISDQKCLADAAQPPPPAASPSSSPPPAKIAAMGVRIRKHVTMHGLALNVDPDMDHFNLIVPCGLTGRPVVSMRQLLGDRCPEMQEVKAKLVEKLDDQMRLSARITPPGRVVPR
jgi:lipoate-protein ligase B